MATLIYRGISWHRGIFAKFWVKTVMHFFHCVCISKGFYTIFLLYVYILRVFTYRYVYTHINHASIPWYSSPLSWSPLLGPISLTVFHRNSNSMEISFLSHLDSNRVIATKYCTWHDSCAICCDLMAGNGIMARRNFHRIWIAGKKC